MEPIVVVGAGVAGLSCARALADAGRDVVVLDRGRRPGGRASGARRLGERTASVGIGPPGFAVTDPAFARVVAEWADRGVVLPPRDGWAALRTPAGLAEVLAPGVDVRPETTVERVGPGPPVDGTPAAAVVLAMPGPQAARLLDPSSAAAGQTGGEWLPTIVVAMRFADRTWPPLHVRRLGGPEVELVVDDGRGGELPGQATGERPEAGRRELDDQLRAESPVLVAHATPARSALHLDDPAGAVEPVLGALRHRLRLTEPVDTHAHRWTFARPVAPRTAPFHLGEDRIGLCGDDWHAPQTGVEAAWLSGRRLAAALAT